MSFALDRYRSSCFACCLGLLMTASWDPAHAASLKAVMKEMAGTTKLAKGAAASGDVAQAEAVLGRYAAEAKAAGASIVGGDAKAQDLRGRFSTLAATAEGAQPTHFKTAFGAIVDQCRSCHSAYK